MKKKILHFFLVLMAANLIIPMAISKDYIIFSILQDFSMGIEKEVLKKNYYINIGSKQGVFKDTELDVFRLISLLDPYQGKSRYNYKVKIGTLKVLHSEDDIAIAALESIRTEKDDPYFELNGFMVGDSVKVSIDD